MELKLSIGTGIGIELELNFLMGTGIGIGIQISELTPAFLIYNATGMGLPGGGLIKGRLSAIWVRAASDGDEWLRGRVSQGTGVT